MTSRTRQETVYRRSPEKEIAMTEENQTGITELLQMLIEDRRKREESEDRREQERREEAEQRERESVWKSWKEKNWNVRRNRIGA